MDKPSPQLEILKASLGPLPEAVVRPPLIVVSGLPGTGKSYFCRRLLERLPAVWVESDALRKVLFPQPSYSAEESSHLFDLLHQLVGWLLSRGFPVLFDATNLAEHRREYLYSIAERRGARLILVRVDAPEDLVRQRLLVRAGDGNGGDHSEADWQVYRKMKDSVEPIRRSYFAVDTSRDIAPVVEKVLREARR